MDSLSALIGHSLEMVCVNSNQIYFHFGTKSYLVVESRYRVSLGTDVPGVVRGVSDISQEVLRPLDRDVVTCSIEEDSTLKISFDGGCSIEAYKNAGYESYKVIIDGKEVFAV
jgi:hypothetical protein